MKDDLVETKPQSPKLGVVNNDGYRIGTAPGRRRIHLRSIETGAAEDPLEVEARSFVNWLEAEYHRNNPHGVRDDVTIDVTDMPQAELQERIEALLTGRKWLFSTQMHESSGCQAGCFTLSPIRR